MNYAITILETELKSLKSREFPSLIKLYGGYKGQKKRIKEIEDAILILSKDKEDGENL
jgi:hypothetical protein